MKLLLPAALAALCLLAASARAATIVEFRGRVEYRTSESAEWTQVVRNVRLETGAELHTYRGSVARVSTDDGAIIAIGPDSNFKVGEESASESTVGLLWGRLRAVVSGKNRNFRVRTPNAVAAVRGTDFGVIADDGGARVEVYEGVVNASDLSGRSIDVGAGQFTEIPRDGAPMAPQSNPGPPPAMESSSRDARTAALREVYQEISKESVLAQAQAEIQSAEYQNRKVAIDAFGFRVRMEEYITRPTADSFKYVVLNTRDDRFDFGKILFAFNKALPEDLTQATKNMLSATGSTAPEWQLEELSSVMSNTNDKVVEDASGGHMVADDASDPSEWSLFFSNYAVYVGDASSTANGGKGTQLWGFVDNGDNVPQSGEFTFLGGQAPTSASRTPSGDDVFHTIVKNTYADGTWIQAEDFVTFDDGKVAAVADFAASSSLTLSSVADRLNFERVYTSSLFSGRKIDLVFSAKLLKDAGLLRLE